MSTAKFGAFGKIPAVGDFFRINAPPGFATVWDEWLQRCLVFGADAYGSRWDELYMSVPIWRFCLPAGLAGPGAVIGVLMPSVDRVGRRFPLTLMAPLDDGASTIRSHLLEADIFGQLEAIALSVLDEDISKDILNERLSSLHWEAAHDTGFRKGAKAGAIACKASTPANLMSCIAADCLSQSFASPTIWSTTMLDDTRLMVCDGLPEGGNMQGLFDLDADLWKEGSL